MATEEERERLAEIVEYTRRDLAQRGSSDPVVHIHYHAAPAPEPMTVPPPTVLEKYTPHMILAVFFLIIFGIFAIVFAMIAQALMIGMISMAVASLAVAAAVRSMRTGKYDAEMMRQRLEATESRRKHRR
jgi:hypothetical protein